jgi:hypothetical protein
MNGRTSKLIRKFVGVQMFQTEEQKNNFRKDVIKGWYLSSPKKRGKLRKMYQKIVDMNKEG